MKPRMTYGQPWCTGRRRLALPDASICRHRDETWSPDVVGAAAAIRPRACVTAPPSQQALKRPRGGGGTRQITKVGG
eukprot:324199-Chlamydomonas_euryale.AAC.1